MNVYVRALAEVAAQLALDVRGVHDVDDAVRLLVQYVIPRDDLLLGIGTQGVDTRQVHHGALLVLPYLSGFLVHRHAGEIPHVLVGAGQSIEQRSLAAVLVSNQRKGYCLTLRQRQAVGFNVVYTALSKSRMLCL